MIQIRKYFLSNVFDFKEYEKMLCESTSFQKIDAIDFYEDNLTVITLLNGVESFDTEKFKEKGIRFFRRFVSDDDFLNKVLTASQKENLTEYSVKLDQEPDKEHTGKRLELSSYIKRKIG